MEKVITADNLASFAYVNDKALKKAPRGVVLGFVGLGGATMYNVDTHDGDFYGAEGVLYVFPYYNPWAWMNRATVAFTDEILDVVFEKYGLSPDTPVVSTGGSMGGLSSLVYCAYAKRTPVACVADCPVCDAVYHYDERPDLPRTLVSALYEYEGTLESALKAISPIHLIDKMPDIKYRIYHCEADQAVNKQHHSDVMVRLLKKKNYDVRYYEIPDRGHCQLPFETRMQFRRRALAFATKGEEEQ